MNLRQIYACTGLTTLLRPRGILGMVLGYESQADKKIFFVDYESQADLVLRRYPSQSKWKNRGKMHLMF